MNSAMLLNLPSAFTGSAVLLNGLDLLLSSMIVLSIFAVADALLGRRMTPGCRHLLWLNAVLCLALLPVLPALSSFLPDDRVASGPALIHLVTALPGQVSESAEASLSLGQWATMIYIAIAAVLGVRLLVSLWKLVRIQRHAWEVEDSHSLARLAHFRKALGISRSVSLHYSHLLGSPVSWGLRCPHILLPEASRQWSTSQLDAVLVHELGHIRRLDWLSLILAYLLVSLYWPNPLSWFAMRRMNEEAEASCDASVLARGESRTDYAQCLVDLARGSRRQQSRLGMQAMLTHDELKTRVYRILEGKNMRTRLTKKQFTLRAMTLVLFSGVALAVAGSATLISAQEQAAPRYQEQALREEQRRLEVEIRRQEEEVLALREQQERQEEEVRRLDRHQEQARQEEERRRDYAAPQRGSVLPVNSVMPQYPTIAAEQEIEGWVLVSFTVDAAGNVEEGSLRVVDHEPSDVFNNSAIRAARQFKFTPHMRDGRAVSVPNVEYLFRYHMTDDNQTPEGQRPPPSGHGRSGAGSSSS